MDCWQREITRSETEAEVVDITRDFLTLWSPRELTPLTFGWREVRIDSAADIERMKRWIVEDLDSERSVTPGARELKELGDYLWHAAARIAEIRAG